MCLTSCVTSGKFLTWKWGFRLENLWSPFQVWHSLILGYRNIPHKCEQAFPFLSLPSLRTRPLTLPAPAAFFWPMRLPGPQEPPSGHVKNSLTRRLFLQLLLNLRDYRHPREPSFFDAFTSTSVDTNLCNIFQHTHLPLLPLPTLLQLPQGNIFLLLPPSTLFYLPTPFVCEIKMRWLLFHFLK